VAHTSNESVTTEDIEFALNWYGHYERKRADRFYTWYDTEPLEYPRDEQLLRAISSRETNQVIDFIGGAPYARWLCDVAYRVSSYKRLVLSDPQRGPFLGRVHGTSLTIGNLSAPQDRFARNEINSLRPADNLETARDYISGAVRNISSHYAMSEADARKVVFEGLFYPHSVSYVFRNLIDGYLEGQKTYQDLSPEELLILLTAATVIEEKIERGIKKEIRHIQMAGIGIILLVAFLPELIAAGSWLYDKIAKINWAKVKEITTEIYSIASTIRETIEAAKEAMKETGEGEEELPPPPPPPGGEEEEAGRTAIPLVLIAAGALALIALTSTE